MKSTPMARMGGRSLSAHVRLDLGGQVLETDLEVPQRTVRAKTLLPQFRKLTDAMVSVAIAAEETQGRAVSCRAGCAACCRQPVPLAESEARDLHRWIENLPAARRTKIRARFRTIRDRLEESGLLARLRGGSKWTPAERRAFALDYLRLDLACPFLEAESCSIYERRPLVCREYLVTSPAENCRHPGERDVRPVAMPRSVWVAVAELHRRPVPPSPDVPPPNVPFVPLVLASEWAESHPDTEPPQPAPQLMENVLRHLGRPAASPHTTTTTSS